MLDYSVVEDYLQALRDCSNLRPPIQPVDFQIQKGRRFLKVVRFENGQPSSVHAFIDASNGDLIKAAGWSAPQRNADKSLAVRWSLSDDAARKKLTDLLRSDASQIHGGYLYKR